MPLRSRIPSEMIEKFKSLGFTKYEALAYLALVVNGPMTAGELANEAGIPYSRVNDTTASLEKRGFVEINIGERKVFVAVPPNIAFSRLKNEIDLLKMKIDDYSTHYTKEERPFMLHLRKTTDLVSFIEEILKSTSHELTIVLPEGSEHILNYISSNENIDEITVVIISKKPLDFTYALNYVVEDPGDNILMLSDASRVLMIPYVSYKYGGRNKVLGFYTNYKEVVWYVYSFVRRITEHSEDIKVHRTYMPRFSCLFNVVAFYKSTKRAKVKAHIKKVGNEETKTIIGDIIKIHEDLVNNVTIREENGTEYTVGGLYSVLEDWEAIYVEFL